jgi:23S rRNA pseudouridine2605 synthase
MTKIRINKFLSDSGICSRREADEHILAGEVKVNDMVASLGNKIDPNKDEIKFKDKVVKTREGTIYYAVYKPKGHVSTADDEMGRKTVLDLVPSSPRVYPIGRLDMDSEGLIILTDDGELTNLLTHPKNEHEKEYEVVVKWSKHNTVTMSEIEQKFVKGLFIEGKLMKADKVEASMPRVTSCILNITIHTGYNRQIRKMCAKLGLEVARLKRIRIAKLQLENLKLEPGKYKVVQKEQIV